MKVKTNESKLKKLISKNDSVLNALLLERIIKIMEITNEDIEKNPQSWENSIINVNLIQRLYKNVSETLN